MNLITATACATVSVPCDPATTALNVVSDMGLALSLASSPPGLELSITCDAWGAARLHAAAPDPNALLATVAARPLGRERVSVHVIITANKERRARAAVTELMLAVPTLAITPTRVSCRPVDDGVSAPFPVAMSGLAKSGVVLQ